MYEHVLQPLTLGSATLRNRVVRAAHGTGHALAGGINDDWIAYHVARARGGVAMSVFEIAGVHPSGPGLLVAWDDSIIPQFERAAEAVHEHGMLAFQQLFHGGHNVPPIDGSPPWSASRVPSPQMGVMPRPMTKGMIDEVVGAYAAAAGRVVAGGLDGVEIHAGHGYLPAQFLSPAVNHREDDYGGPLENRARFLLEILDAVRNSVPKGFPVGVRLSTERSVTNGLEPEEVARILRLLDTDDVTYINLSVGSYYEFDRIIGGTYEPHGYEVEFNGPLARGVSRPVLLTGRFMTLAEADAVIGAGDADMVSMVRALIADPDLVNKSTDGRAAEVRPCIACNQACVGGVFGPRMRLNCTVNVGAGKELRFGDDLVIRDQEPKRVLVIGAGPAGLEAARVARMSGHEVLLRDAADEIGGQLRLVRNSPHRSDVAGVIDWFGRELDRLGVDVKLGTRIGRDDVASIAPDAVILATGSRPRSDGFQSTRPGLTVPGLDGVTVASSWDILGGDGYVPRSAVVVDDHGHFEPIDVASFLAAHGCEVTYVCRYATAGANLEGAWDMIGKPYQERLLEAGVRLLTRHALAEVQDGEAVVVSLDCAEITHRVPVDCVVFVSVNLPDDELLELLSDLDCEVQAVGDVITPAGLEAAITQGHMAALSLRPGHTADGVDTQAALQNLLTAQHR